MVSDVSSTEAALLSRISKGEEPALSELYDRVGGLVYSVAYHILQNATLAEEVTQDTFMKVWTQAHAWDSTRGRVSTWMATIARYTAIDRLRVEQRRDGKGQVDIDDVINVLGSTAEMDEPGWADGRLVRDMMTALPDDQRQVVELAYFKDMSHTEMAEHLNIPLGTVKGRARAALMKLREMWQAQTERE